MTGTWATDWATNDVVTAAEFRKSMGCVFDSTLGASAASIDITGLPTTYAHALVIAYLRGDIAATSAATSLRFNNDSGANYDFQFSAIFGTTPTLAASEGLGLTLGGVGDAAGSTAPANVFNGFQIWLPNYGNSTNNKTWSFQTQAKRSVLTGDQRLNIGGGQWRSNVAINRLTLLPVSGNFVSGSRVSVYVMGS